MLNETEVTAAIGYAGTIVFTNLSVAIGSGIAAAALVARNVGAGDQERARQFATSALMFSLIIVGRHHARDRPRLRRAALAARRHRARRKRLAQLFIWTLTPGYILIAGAICCSFILRGLGDARRAMYITLSAAIVTACIDPIFIFGFGWGIQGAAAATVAGLHRFLRHRAARRRQGAPLPQSHAPVAA